MKDLVPYLISTVSAFCMVSFIIWCSCTNPIILELKNPISFALAFIITACTDISLYVRENLKDNQ